MILARYLLKELLVPLVVWVAFLFLLLFVMQFLRGTEVLLGSAVTLGDIGRLILYLAPHFLVMALPIAFLLAILLGLGRLSEDRELTALQALGISPTQLLAGPRRHRRAAGRADVAAVLHGRAVGTDRACGSWSTRSSRRTWRAM